MTKAALQMEIDKLVTALSEASRCYSIDKARIICSKALVHHGFRKLSKQSQ